MANMIAKTEEIMITYIIYFIKNPGRFVKSLHIFNDVTNHLSN